MMNSSLKTSPFFIKIKKRIAKRWNKSLMTKLGVDYHATPQGDIYQNGKKLKSYINSHGYACVFFKNPDGSHKKKPLLRKVHRLVAIQYIPNFNPDEKPQVNHINGDKLDNRVENLEWVSNRENWFKYAQSDKANPRHKGAKELTREQILSIRKELANGAKQTQLASQYGINPKTIRQIKKGVVYSDIK